MTKEYRRDIEDELNELRAKVKRYERPLKQKIKEGAVNTKVMIGLKLHDAKVKSQQKYHDWKDAQDTIKDLRKWQDRATKEIERLNKLVNEPSIMEKVEEFNEQSKSATAGDKGSRTKD